ncbi:formate dehydrogenase accessory sulfurtransferase FdhD [Porticoccus sp. W117]|uniref:formate dehydrogenase accessory sulfurtransferase FdhD n=1 Tax=Porticoccus sp. W117 TaxID=3054777 RepID=UPI0025927D89|nr:formate dehydrogenase accessory sulfurtransferase FdhD [Porticoccus sp. W117]MDM3871867.1 formate dehydrogenase accessory sulfurtransferase FdhD [Porticoccus sp. W117]
MSTLDKGHRSIEVHRHADGVIRVASDQVAAEVPVALVYNGISHVVMMVTPDDLEEFALGFSLTEGIIESAEELYEAEIVETDNGIELQLTISERRFQALKEWRRNLTGRTGCGLCGAESLEQVIQLPQPLSVGEPIVAAAIGKAMARLQDYQPLNQRTGATHAAAWADSEGNIIAVCEDVGRHNALDKLIGTLSRRQRPEGFLIVTSRASYEMIQKAGWANMGLIAAVSAPTSLAIELAEKLNITLLGFARDNNFVCYANHQGVAEITS